MIIKEADDKTNDLELLNALAQRPGASAEVRKRIDQEIRNIRSGIKGEAEAAYEIGFHYGLSKNWMVLHDLRLECEGRVAQIDHLLMNRFLEFYVCESKRFGEGVAINEHGEFTAFYSGKPFGVPSPLEQNKRHIAVLESVFKTGQVELPTRLGFTLKPKLLGLVLVSKTARIQRPKGTIEGLDGVIKNDQLKAKIDRDIDRDVNVLHAAKIIGSDTLRDLAERLANAHRPISFDWKSRFGLPVEADQGAEPSESTESAPVDSKEAGDGRKSRLICSDCGVPVSYNVAKFCWFNKPRFGGKVFCMDCQKKVATANG